MSQPKNFLWRLEGGGKVGVITLNRPERKNPLTFESYAELRDFFASLKNNSSVKNLIRLVKGYRKKFRKTPTLMVSEDILAIYTEIQTVIVEITELEKDIKWER